MCVYCNRSQNTSQRVKNNSHATPFRLVSYFMSFTRCNISCDLLQSLIWKIGLDRATRCLWWAEFEAKWRPSWKDHPKLGVCGKSYCEASEITFNVTLIIIIIYSGYPLHRSVFQWGPAKFMYNTVTIQYNTIQYDTMRYDTIRYDTIRYAIRYAIRYD